MVGRGRRTDYGRDCGGLCRRVGRLAAPRIAYQPPAATASEDDDRDHGDGRALRFLRRGGAASAATQIGRASAIALVMPASVPASRRHGGGSDRAYRRTRPLGLVAACNACANSSAVW